MPGESRRPRGEAGRVAARVRELLGDPDDEEVIGQRDEPLRPTLGSRLAARFPMRVDPGRRAAVAVGLAVVVAAVGTGVWLMSARPRVMPVSARAPGMSAAAPLSGAGSADTGPSDGGASGTSRSSVASASSAAAEVVVDVAGRVRHPGLYRLEPGARVDDALRAAGGPVGHVDLSRLNLAAKVVDGQQIAVGLPGAAGGGAGAGAGGVATGAGAPLGGGATGGTTGGAPVSLNSASAEQLEGLPGVGPVLAQHILDWRTQHGSFTSIDQLQDVSGIGDVKFATLQPLVTL